VLNAQRCAAQQMRRNFGATAVVTQKAAGATDPIQQLFVNQIQDYTQKKKANKLEMTPDVQKAYDRMSEAIFRKYGVKDHGGKFPEIFRMVSTEIKNPFKSSGKIRVPADNNGNSLIDESSGAPLFKNIADSKGAPAGFVVTYKSGNILPAAEAAMKSNAGLYSGGKAVYKVLPYVKEDGTEVADKPGAVVLPMTKSGAILKQIGPSLS